MCIVHVLEVVDVQHPDDQTIPLTPNPGKLMVKPF
jgi:hypothetical protein